MGLLHSPRIVTDGLVLCLDAANKRSYPGAGTTWTDLSKNKNNGTLTNGPTFDSANGGRFSFDGSNDYCEFAENEKYNFQPTQPFSVFCWMIKSGSYGAVLANMKSGSPYQGWDIWNENSTHISMHIISSWIGNAIKLRVDYTDQQSIKYFGYTYNGSCPANSTDTLNSVNFYVDGELYTTGKAIADGAGSFDSTSETISYPAGQKFRIGSRYTGQYGASNLFAVHIYNKALTANEVQQNYNATKARFGL